MLRDAAARLLELVAAGFGWAAALLSLVDSGTDLLRWAEDWSEDDPALAELCRIARPLTFTRDAGAPGRVWTSGEPAWVGDLSTDPHFLRGKAARRAGLASAVVLPVVAPEGVLGVIEFFGRAYREPVGRRRTLVGALPDPLLQDSELLLGAGDLLLLYTDGVTESRTPAGRFAIDGLAGVLARCAGLPAGAVVDRVQAAVADAPGHETPDDVALLALRPTG